MAERLNKTPKRLNASRSFNNDVYITPNKRSRRSSENIESVLIQRTSRFFIVAGVPNQMIRLIFVLPDNYGPRKKKFDHVVEVTEEWRRMTNELEYDHVLRMLPGGYVSSNETFYHKKCLLSVTRHGKVDSLNEDHEWMKELYLNKIITVEPLITTTSRDQCNCSLYRGDRSGEVVL